MKLKKLTKQDWMVLAGIVVLLTLLVVAYFAILPHSAFASDLFSRAEDVVGDGQTKIVSFATKVCPLALIVVLICLMCTHNEKKISLLITIGGTILVAYVLILVVNSGIVVNTLRAWFT